MIEGTQKVCIVERDIVNYRGVLALKGSSTLLDEFSLTGLSTEVNVKSCDFQTKLETQTQNFFLNASGIATTDDLLFTLVNCHGEDNGEYTVFCGKKLIIDGIEHEFKMRTVPGGWYVCFRYSGDMFEAREPLNDDLYRWIMVKEAEIVPNGIGMMNIFNSDYLVNKKVDIYIPIKRPV